MKLFTLPLARCEEEANFTIVCKIFPTKMRRPALIAWPLLFYFFFLLNVVANDSNDYNDVRLEVTIRKDTLKGVPSCQHTFSQVELLNLVSFCRMLYIWDKISLFIDKIRSFWTFFP